MEHPEVRELIDLDQPVALLLLAILHFVPDDEDPFGSWPATGTPCRPAATWPSPTAPGHPERPDMSLRSHGRYGGQGRAGCTSSPPRHWSPVPAPRSSGSSTASTCSSRAGRDPAVAARRAGRAAPGGFYGGVGRRR
jgi:hypothetical protein